MSQDLVCNALDNMKARFYVDEKCCFYELPLLESGTMGTGANVDVVVPHVTKSYADGGQADEGGGVPMCTLRNFPHLIDHCIEWARAQFTEQFVAPFQDAAKFMEDPAAYIKSIKDPIDALSGGKKASAVAQAIKPMRSVCRVASLVRDGVTIEACLKMAFDLFHTYFRDRIVSLISKFPEDKKNEDGSDFWSGAKRFPQVATFDPENETHLGFVTAVGNLFAVNYGLVPPPEESLLPGDHKWRSPEFVKSVVATFSPPEVVEEKVEDVEEEEEGEEGAGGGGGAEEDEDIKAFESCLAQLEALAGAGITARVEVADFEKDQDLNFHIDFITATSNLRATNYYISTASRHKCKMIAGKIIPAIATTTASVCGLVMIELYKLLAGKDAEAFKDSSNNLGNNSYFFSTPAEPIKKTKFMDPATHMETLAVPDGFTIWDKTKLKGSDDLTVKGVMDLFTEVTGGCELEMLFHPAANDPDSPYSSKFIYHFMVKSTKANLDRPFKEVCEELYGGKDGEESPILPAGKRFIELDVSAITEDGDDCIVPTVLYYF
jgi:ubiquitin-activating enzyme E1